MSEGSLTASFATVCANRVSEIMWFYQLVCTLSCARLSIYFSAIWHILLFLVGLLRPDP